MTEVPLSSMPWLSEPNERSWTMHQLPCRLRRGPVGAWCGYVGIPPDHPLYGVDYSEQSPALVKMLHGRGEDRIVDPEDATPDIVFEVHGGITYAGEACPGSPDEEEGRWWYGFDCAHSGDLYPAFLDFRFQSVYFDYGLVYRDIDYATGETEKLAEQLASVEAL